MGFRYMPTIYGLTGCQKALPGSGSDLGLVATGTRTAAENDHYVDAMFRQGHKLEVPTCLSHPVQVANYPGQIHMGIAGAAIFQRYFNLVTILRHFR